MKFALQFSAKHKSLKAIASVLTTTALLAACAPANPQKMAPPEAELSATESAPINSRVDFVPKADILFVVDNSDSMKEHQAKLKANIANFVKAFDGNKRLDFHIGVVSVFDSKRYGKVVQNFKPIGEMYTVKAEGAQAGALGSNYVTRFDGYQKVLGDTIEIGTIARGTDKNDLGGPEFEESFSPVLAALDGKNVGFLRPEAHLAVIMVTDANDESSISAEKLQSELRRIKGTDTMFSTYAVLATGKDPKTGKACKQDPGGGPDRILEFIRLTKGQSFSLCDGAYGQKLAQAGRSIEQAASKDAHIALEQVPEEGTLEVVIAGTNEKIDFKYDADHIAVIVPASAMANQPADAQIEIRYKPIDSNVLGTNRTRAASVEEEVPAATPAPTKK